MKNFVELVKTKNLGLNEKGELKQNLRNDFRADTIEAIMELFEENGVECVRTGDGIGVELANEEIGSVIVMVDVTVKPHQFDLVGAVNEYERKLVEKAEKEAEKARIKAQNEAEKQAKALAKKNAKK